MKSVAVTQAVAKGRSERGASLSLALLLVLVCVALSAAVLAASTASAGRFAEQGEMDQRYYAVASAADLFKSSLGESGEVSYVFTQRKDANGLYLVFPTGKVQQGGAADGASQAAGYDFLPDLTYHALFGARYNVDKNTSASLGASDSQFVEPFSSSWWTASPRDVTYSITSTNDKLKGAVGVDVTARLSSDWTLDLDFRNAAAESDDERFHLVMSLAADVSQQDSITGAVSQRTTTVTWHLRQIEPGGKPIS